MRIADEQVRQQGGQAEEAGEAAHVGRESADLDGSRASAGVFDGLGNRPLRFILRRTCIRSVRRPLGTTGEALA